MLQSLRLRSILAAQKIHLSILRVFRLTLIGQFFNNFLPTVVGGDAIKAYYASGVTNKKLESFTSVIVDRMLGLVTLMAMAITVLAINYDKVQDKVVVFIVFLMFIGASSFLLFIFDKSMPRRFGFLRGLVRRLKLEDKLRRLYGAASQYRHHKILILRALLLSLGAQVTCISMACILSRGIGSNLGIVHFFLTLPAVSAVSMLPSINGLGIRESGFVYFLGPLMGTENALALSLLWLAIYLGSSLIGGVVFAFERRGDKK